MDIMRGVAVLGIFFINVFVFAQPSTALAFPQLWGDAVFWNTATWSINEIFLDGTMRGLFSILFGASALVFLSEVRLAEQGAAVIDRYYRRTILLLLFGVVHGFVLLNLHDVLYAYGLLGMFLFPLRNVDGRTLLICGAAFLTLASVHISTQGGGAGLHEAVPATLMSAEARAGFNVGAREHMQDEIALYLMDYPTIFFYQFDYVVSQESMVMYTTHLFDIGGMMLIGMALFKLGVLNGSRSALFYLALAVAGYAVGGGALRGYGVYQIYAADFDPGVLQTITNRTMYGMDRLAITLGHVGAIGLLCKASWAGVLTRPLAALGRMALTSYISHTVMSIFLFYGFGLGLFGTMQRLEIYLVALIVCAAQIVLSVVWLNRYRLGPLEWVWRSLIYGKPLPMKRTLPGASALDAAS
ncbi:MAG: DUF418 domain-containing protein [Alphaproteobacteria bacterium]|nr:DUF418 domain-containing protein [Alphaproteobacteria bacterium]